MLIGKFFEKHIFSYTFFHDILFIGKVSKKPRDESRNPAPMKRGLFVTYVPAVHYYQGTLYPDFAEFVFPLHKMQSFYERLNE